MILSGPSTETPPAGLCRDTKLGVHPPAGVLPADDLGAGRHETHARIIVVREDGLGAVVGEVEGADVCVGHSLEMHLIP